MVNLLKGNELFSHCDNSAGLVGGNSLPDSSMFLAGLVSDRQMFPRCIVYIQHQTHHHLCLCSIIRDFITYFV